MQEKRKKCLFDFKVYLDKVFYWSSTSQASTSSHTTLNPPILIWIDTRLSQVSLGASLWESSSSFFSGRGIVQLVWHGGQSRGVHSATKWVWGLMLTSLTSQVEALGPWVLDSSSETPTAWWCHHFRWWDLCWRGHWALPAYAPSAELTLVLNLGKHSSTLWSESS